MARRAPSAQRRTSRELRARRAASRFGVFVRCVILLPFRRLQRPHAITRFSRELVPPFERGRTWSIVAVRLRTGLRQYQHRPPCSSQRTRRSPIGPADVPWSARCSEDMPPTARSPRRASTFTRRWLRRQVVADFSFTTVARAHTLASIAVTTCTSATSARRDRRSSRATGARESSTRQGWSLRPSIPFWPKRDGGRSSAAC